MARHFAMGEETTYGTAVTSFDVYMEALSESVQKEIAFERIQTIRTESTRKIEELNTAIRGDVEVVGNYQDLAHAFYALLGSVDTTGAGPYTHTTPASTGIATRPSWTVEISRDTTAQTWRYAGCILTGISVSVAVDQVMRGTLSFIGKSEATGLISTATYAALDVVLPKECTMNFSGSSVDAISFNLSAAYPVDEPYTLGSTSFAKTPESNDVLAVTGDVTVLFDDMTEYNFFDGSTDVDLQLSATNGTEKFIVNLDKARLTQATPHLEGRARLQATYAFETYFNTTATENMQVVVVNDQSAVP